MPKGVEHRELHDRQEYIFSELISDADEAVCTMFDVIVMKSMYGKKVRGIERSTFVIDAAGKIVKEWRGIKVPGHVDEVLEVIESLG